MVSKPVQIPERVVENARSRGRFGNLQYPAEGSTHGVYMEFNKYEYRGGAVAGVRKAGSIALPLPQNISDALNINVAPKELGVMGAALTDLLSGSGMNVLNSALSGTENLGGAVGETISKLLTGDVSGATSTISNQATYASYLAKAGLSSLASGFGDAISATSGAAINPHATLVFDGVTMKQFNFNWTLAPANEYESNQIHRIIRTIQAKSLPKYQAVGNPDSGSSLSRGILEYPNMVDIYFVGFDPNKIFRFKRSMIQQVTVDYSSQGNVMIRGANGSAPAIIQFGINFVESEIWTQDDYRGFDDGTPTSSIGVGPR